VRKARKDYAPDYAPASRVGRDGKRYPAEVEGDARVTFNNRPIPSAHGAFVMRASYASDLATYDETDGPMADDLINVAEHTANAWKQLVERLKAGRSKHGNKKD
jgi:hypothetical protein